MNEWLYRTQAAAQTLTGVIRLTPLTAAPSLSGLTDGAVYLKQENCQVDEYVLVDETELAQAISWLYEEQGSIVESAGALAVAAFWQRKMVDPGRLAALRDFYGYPTARRAA